MKIQRFRIWSIEHNKWWAPHSMGYVSDIVMAGIYSLEEAIVLCNFANVYPKDASGEMRVPFEAMVPVRDEFGE